MSVILENVDVPLPTIYHGEKVSDRKSVFMGHLAQVTHKKQVSTFNIFLLELCE